MSYFRFNTDDVEDFVLNQLGVDLLIKSNNPDEIVFFSNGDRMTINPKEKTMDWEPIKPGEMFTSRLSLRLHQWFGKGHISPIKSPTPT